MLAKKWLFNIALMGMALFFAFKTYGVWHAPEPITEAVEKTPPKRIRTSQFINKRRVPPQDSYNVVTERNLFSRNRTEFVAEKEIVATKNPTQSRYAKRVALFGVFIEGDERLALISQAKIGKRAAKEDIWVKVGDTINNLKVVGIERDRIYLKEGSNTYEITLYDRDHPQKRKRKRPSQDDGPTVISTKAGAPQKKPKRTIKRRAPKKSPTKKAPSQVTERIVKRAEKTDDNNN